MRTVFGAWIVAQLIGALMPGQASANPYVVSDPRVNPSWGRPKQPIAPSVVRDAALDIPTTTSGAEWLARYMEELEASPPTLDAAAAFHFYASPNTFNPMSLGRRIPQLFGAAAAAVAETLEEKGRKVEPALMEELDRRFDALAAAVQGADSIVLPAPNDPGERAASYCQWIARATGNDAVPLANRVREHCIGRRDQFIGVLVDRIADLTTIPALLEPTFDAPTPATWATEAPRLSYLVLPGDRQAPMEFGPLQARLEQRLGSRYEAMRGNLEAQLRSALARRAASDVVLPPEEDCRTILGPYGSALPSRSPAAEVAGDLWHVCMDAIPIAIAASLQRIGDGIMAGLSAEADQVRTANTGDTRIEQTAQATCESLLAPHFPAARSLYFDPASFPSTPRFRVLGRACISVATKIRQLILNKHLAAALAGVPGRDPTGAWATKGWFAAPPGGTDWIDRSGDPAALAWFTDAYEAAVAPRRKEAAIKAAEAVSSSPDATAGAFPDGDPCALRKRTPADAALGATLGTDFHPGENALRANALRAKPALSAGEADDLLTLTCRIKRESAIAARNESAERLAGLSQILSNGERLAVPRHADGILLEVDALALVRGAAADGIQVAFAPGGLFSSPSMSVVPLGAASPRLDGTLREEKEGDGTRRLVIRSLVPLPGLRTPEETVICLQTPVYQAAGEARLKTIVAFAGSMLSYFPELHGSEIRHATTDEIAVEACRAAKATFTGKAGAAVQ